MYNSSSTTLVTIISDYGSISVAFYWKANISSNKLNISSNGPKNNKNMEIDPKKVLKWNFPFPKVFFTQKGCLSQKKSKKKCF